ncbi:MAG: hypothetical protein M1831_000421 [Alyxoria varia]|nr:MAG: hypothetical protein M1831_000421 [Alyxoria varia]
MDDAQNPLPRKPYARQPTLPPESSNTSSHVSVYGERSSERGESNPSTPKQMAQRRSRSIIDEPDERNSRLVTDTDEDMGDSGPDRSKDGRPQSAFKPGTSSARRGVVLANATIDTNEDSTLPDRESAGTPLLPAPLNIVTESHHRPSKSPIRHSPVSGPEKTHSHSSTKTPPPSSSSRKGSLFSKIGTLRPERFRSQSKYHELHDEPGANISLEPVRGSVDDLNHDDTGDSVGIDLSSFGGPETLNRLATFKAPSKTKSQLSPGSRDNGLESKGHLTAAIGYGMDDVVEATLDVPSRAVTPSRQESRHAWRNLGGSIHRTSTKRPGQEVAEMSGQVVAIDEVPTVDMSNVEGGMHSRKPTTDFEQLANSATQSYYFPPDPDMPDWRPPTMRQRYVVLLVCIALVFGAITEYLTQLSLQRAPDGGLLVFRDPREVSDLDWFAWKYMPTMVILFYGIMWQATDFEVRRLEPYYQLSKPGGATAEESLNMDYLTFWSYLIPFKAFHYRQVAVLLSSFSTIMASAVLPIVLNGAIDMEPDRPRRVKGEPKFVTMNPIWARVMEAIFYIVAAAGLWLMLKLRRKSGLQGDPKGIAGIATMATKSHILNDFRGLDMSSHREIHDQLKNRRYILHKSSLWQGQYLRRTSTKDEDSLSSSKVKPRNPHPIALHLWAGVSYIVALAAFIALIPILEFTEANIVTQRASWFLTALSTLLKLFWTNLETGVRMIEPFYTLSRRHAPATILRLDYNGTIPIYMPFRALLNRHFLVAAVGFGSILTEVLTVVVSSFNVDGTEFVKASEVAFAKATSNETDSDETTKMVKRTALEDKAKPHRYEPSNTNTAETPISFWTSLALALLIPLILAAIASVVYVRRRHAFLPRQPATIASVLAFIAQSKMLGDFVEPEVESEDESEWDEGSDESGDASEDDESESKGRVKKRISSSWKKTMRFSGDAASLKENVDRFSEDQHLPARFKTSQLAQKGQRRRPHQRKHHHRQNVDIATTTVATLKSKQKTYGLGWLRGRDGGDHLGVDEEELLADYRHGVNWRAGRIGGMEDGYSSGIGRWEVY